jgi:5-formyltetrahydrofolate cyclo-ligase
MEDNRSALRRQALARRASLPPDRCLEWSRPIQDRAVQLPEYLSAAAVALYSPVQNEVDTMAIRDQALRDGKKVFYPKLDREDGPAFARVLSGADFRPGRFGVPEPIGQDLLTPHDGGGLVVFVPGVLFDRWGHRLGRGGGWYDRVLDRLNRRGVFVGLAYEFQIVERVPTENWDQRVHFILTEDRIIDCGEGRGA